MAYARRRSTTRRSTGRGGSRSGARTNYRSRSSSRPVRRSTARRSTRSGGGGGRTIRIEVVQTAPNPVARPELFGKTPVQPKTAKF